MDKVQLHIMTSIINRIIELAGWIVLGVSVILLGVASHIDTSRRSLSPSLNLSNRLLQ
jgi:hypothetical protein